MHFPINNTLYMVLIALYETDYKSLYGKIEEKRKKKWEMMMNMYDRLA